jgi:D-alanyl-lipoteichoic acid acyltransferase DltB (MBOAT superfamily)
MAVERKNPFEDYLRLAFIFAQAILIVLVMKELDIASSALRRIIGVAAVGFIVHHLLPFRLRLPFFVLLSLGSMSLVLGAPNSYDRLLDPMVTFTRVGILLAIGIVLIGICHLPIGFWQRCGLLLGAAVVMGIFRAGILKLSGLDFLWIVLAAIFMFRIIIYLYDISTSQKKPPLTQSLAYFFLMPNVCFTLFPVIDFKTFCGSYYNESPLEIYQRGMRWMVRGVIQLILYRFIYQLLYIKASDVANGADLIQFLITNLFLYLKISGQFHLIVGVLLLFGFNLPETNHFYFLASSFTDYWRRINIYWKDFMMKIFYYPSFFKLKRYGPTKALILSTLWVFFATWALHLYQTWWLIGSATVTWPDALFWSILGFLVLLNSVWEMKKVRKRKLVAGRYSGGEALRLMFRTAGTFACLCLLWSLWSAPSLETWVHLWTYADSNTLLWGAAVLAAVMLSKFVLEILPAWRTRSSAVATDTPSFWKSIRRDMVQYAAPLFILYVATHSAVQSRLDAVRLQPFQDVLATGDTKIIKGGEGYYENLTSGVNEGERQLWEILMRTPRPTSRNLYNGAHPVRPTKDLRFREPIPNTHVMAYETDFQTNRWGMRDRDYEIAKPAGTIRIAVLGSSQAMGWGVRQEETFAKVLEKRLNNEFSPSFSPRRRYEVLNFAFNGLGPFGQIPLLHDRVRNFSPDIIIYKAKLLDFKWANRDLAKAWRERIPIPDVYLQEVLYRARVTPRTREDLAKARLVPFEPTLLSWCYNKIVEECRSMNAQPVCLFIVFPSDFQKRKNFEWGDIAMSDRLKASAEDAGFILADMSQLFAGKNPEDYLTKGVLPHCNPIAHAMIADALYKELTTNPRFGLYHDARRASIRVEGGLKKIESQN